MLKLELWLIFFTSILSGWLIFPVSTSSQLSPWLTDWKLEHDVGCRAMFKMLFTCFGGEDWVWTAGCMSGSLLVWLHGPSLRMYRCQQRAWIWFKLHKIHAMVSGVEAVVGSMTGRKGKSLGSTTTNYYFYIRCTASPQANKCVLKR